MKRALVLAVVAACGQVDEHRHLDGGSDGPSADASPDARVPTCFGATFSAPAPVAALNTTAPDMMLRLSADELTAYFSRGGGAAAPMFFVATRASATSPFGTATSMTVGTATELLSPTVTADGLTMLFTSARTGTLGAQDIWLATRAATTATFGNVTNVSAANSTGIEDDVYVVPDGSAIYFSSDRNGQIFSVLRAEKSGASYANPQVVLATTNQLSITRVVVSADELTMFYQVGNEIHETHRNAASDAWTLGTRIMELNSANADHPTWLSADGCRIYLESDRTPTTGALDLYVAVRTPQ